MNNSPALEQAFHMQTNQPQVHTHQRPSSTSLTHQAALTHLGPETRQLETTPLPQSLLTVSKLASSELLPCPALFYLRKLQ